MDNKIDLAPGFMIRVLQQVSVSIFHSSLESEELTPIQHTILKTAAANKDLDQSTIASLAFLDASTTGDVVKRLEKRGLLSREVSEMDRRSRVVNITRQGRQLLKRVSGKIEAAQNFLLSPLAPAERDRFLASLEKILVFHENIGSDEISGPWQRGNKKLS
ncbi:MarR family winged helix-turn-helix transcriptional regulator [Haliea sp. E17]|uniref:MarR family winged helix-turn-helix transcriptional regulator n=1 Tax=Haliea sp. E17 TaxID=3401576 RepID=UPI003AB0CB2D